MPPELVVDAGPLIHLDELDCLDLLDDFPVVRIPRQVWEETVAHRSLSLAGGSNSWRRAEVEISVRPEFVALVRSLALDLGEQAALSLMQDHPESIFLTDDSAARLAAKSLGFRAHGTLGVLLRSMRRGTRTKAELLVILESLPDRSSLHLREGLRRKVIESVEHEEFQPF